MMTYEFVDRMRHATFDMLPLMLIPFVSLILSAMITYLSELADEKEIEKRKYKRNLLLSMTAQTKVDLEIKELIAR